MSETTEVFYFSAGTGLHTVAPARGPNFRWQIVSFFITNGGGHTWKSSGGGNISSLLNNSSVPYSVPAIYDGNGWGRTGKGEDLDIDLAAAASGGVVVKAVGV